MAYVHDIKTILSLTKELKVLYVEDEKDIRDQMSEMLKLFFGEVYIATDGAEGIVQYDRHTVDIVITDIQMPRMNGLEMIQRIRENDPYLPVIITTAYNDQDYFIRSIDLKVDKYLLKPIEEERAKEVFVTIAKMMDDRQKAKEYEIQKIQEKMNRLSERLIAQITDSYLFPCIIYTDSQIRYFNDSFCSLFDADDMKRFLTSEGMIIAPFDNKSGYLQSLNEYDKNDPSRNRVSISKRKGRKIYRVFRSGIQLDDNEEISHIYFFIDITLEEYQKVKIKSYGEMLEELVIEHRYRNRGRRAESLPMVSSVETSHASKDDEVPLSKSSVKITIDEDENRILRRSHVQKTAAKEYVAELDYDVLQELQELDELDREFCESIVIVTEDADLDGLRQMALQLERYAHEISLLFEFEDLAYAIRSLATLIKEVEDARIDEKRLRTIVRMLAAIQSDLADWRRMIFVEQSALDIHYLDSSLFSVCLQIELTLSEQAGGIETEEEDLILF